VGRESNFGWPLLVAGLLSAFGCATTKKFFKSDFQNTVDTNVSEEDRRAEVQVSIVQRWLLVALGLLVAAAGASLIHRTHNWNPF
jgi:hypothetical protein